MNDEALLQTLINYAAPKCDAGTLARSMLNRHGSLASVLELLPDDLMRSHALSESAARLLHLIPELTRYIARDEARHMTDVGTLDKAGAYLRNLYIGAHNERFYLLCLNEAGALIDTRLVQQGTVDEAPFYLRRILDLSVRAGAYAVVLSHNHPSGTPYPSRGDIECTMLAIEALLPMDILVLDHVLIADSTAISIRESGAMASVLFTRQKPGDPLIRGWCAQQEV